MKKVCCKCSEILSEDNHYGLHPRCFAEWFNTPNALNFTDLILRTQSQIPIDQEREHISFFNGAYRKYSARLNGIGYILKVKQHEYPELPTTEFLCNQIYESLGIQIPSYFLIHFPEESHCFVTENFMSSLVASDLVHIYHFLEKGTEYNCENLVKIIGSQTGRRIDQERFVTLTLADSLIGNHDRHGRNLGFIRNSKYVSLAPFYDNPSALALEDHKMLGADLQPRGAIYTRESDKPHLSDYIVEWNTLGYGDVVDKFRKKYSSNAISVLIEKSHISEKRKKAFLKLILDRGSVLCQI